MRPCLAFTLLALFCTMLLQPLRAEDAATDTRTLGTVKGRIYDAHTGAPISDAKIVIQQEGVFPTKGKALCKTDIMGEYTCSALLGRISTKYNVGGILMNAILPVGATESTTTKRIDVSRLNLRVSKEGYKTYEGPVRCRTMDAFFFMVVMEPVLLVRADSPEVSAAADGWGVIQIREVTLTPPVVAPGKKATVTVKVQSPTVATRKRSTGSLFGISKAQLKVFVSAPFLKRPVVLAVQTQADDEIIFTGTLTAPKKPTVPSYACTAYIAQSPLEIITGGDTRAALMQVPLAAGDERLAQWRLEADASVRAGDTAAAVTKLKSVCADPKAVLGDHLWLGTLATQLHDHAASTAAYRQALATIPAKAKTVELNNAKQKPEQARWWITSRLAAAMLRDGKTAELLAEFKPLVDAVPEKEQSAKVPYDLMVALGMAYVQRGQLAEASAISERLLKWSPGTVSDLAREFNRDLRVAMADAAVAKNPTDADAWANQGRLLIDLGQWDAAVGKLRKALELNPNLTSVRRDLTYALLHLRGNQQAAAIDLEAALQAAKEKVAYTKEKDKSMNFFDWHAYAILLYTQAYRQREAGKIKDADATMKTCREMFTEAIRCGRSGADQFGGADKIVAIAGFAYPEADSDFRILDSLDTLAEHPEDPLARFTMADALLQLEQPVMAESVLREALKLAPNFVEGRYLEAKLAMKNQDDARAMTLLSEVLVKNPRHPFANIELANLYTQAGDLVSASGCLAAHAAIYGEHR